MEEKIRNLTFIVILGFIILGILIIGLYFKDGVSTNNNNSNNNGSNSSTEGYDVSKMNEVDVDEVLALFEEDGTHVLYIGRSTCSACIQFVPVLNQVQEELNFTTNYLDVQQYMGNWSKAQEELSPLMELATIEATANGETGELGELFIENGFTPVLIVIKDGEIVEGFFGSRSATELTNILEEYL